MTSGCDAAKVSKCTPRPAQPPPPPRHEFGTVGAGFGVNYRLPDGGKWSGFKDGELAMLSRAFKLIRFDMKWEQVEKTCGAYDFSLFDRLVSAALGAGVRLYAILDYSNKCYAKGSCTSDSCIAAYGHWAATTAAHYAGSAGNITFTSNNEPNNPSLGNLGAKTDAQQIKVAGDIMLGAGFLFTGGVTAGVDVDYQKQLVENGALGYVTAMSTHPYTHHIPEYRLTDLKQIRSNKNSRGGSGVKLLLDEWSYPYGGFPTSLDEAAKLLPRMWLLCLSFDLNCDSAIFFDWSGVQKDLMPNTLFKAAEARFRAP